MGQCVWGLLPALRMGEMVMETDKADAVGDGNEGDLDVEAAIDELEGLLEESRWEPQPASVPRK